MKNNDFKARVYTVVSAIKEGHTLTYSQVAMLAGSPGAARAVGTLLSKNYDPQIPCHRVIKANGSAGGYNRGTDNKIKKLQAEGALPIL